MRFKLKFLVASAMALMSAAAFAADDLGEPAITFTSAAFKEIGASNNFGMLLSATETTYFDIDMGYGAQEVEVVPAQVIDGAWVGTYISVRVPEAGVVKIYGDPTKIDVFQCNGGYITDIDLSKCVNLDVVDLEHNALTGLDLTPNTKLSAIYLTDNPGSPQTPIVVGGPKNNLMILEVDIIDYLDPNFDLTQYPALVSFDAYHTLSLKQVDLSNCPDLLVISLEMTSVENVDFSKCPKLSHVNVSDSRVSNLDVSCLPNLQRLLAAHGSGYINTDVKISNLDLTHNPLLFYLAAQGNGMTQIDITKNPEMTNLYLSQNNLSEINLSNNNKLVSVHLSQNRFTFSTLPADQETWAEYFYEQQPYPVQKSVAVGAQMKFPEMIRPDSKTYARLIQKPVAASESPVEDETALTFSDDGTLVINRAFSDSVYVEFSNTALPDYSLYTTPFMVKEADQIGLPSPIVSFGVTSRSTPYTFKVGLDGATAAAPRKLLVDFGDGVRQEFSITSAEALTSVSGTPKGFTVTLYAPEGETITALDMTDQKLTSIDVTKATELRSLVLDGCALPTVNLQYNRCLQSLNLNRNNLTVLDLQAPLTNYEKFVLNRVEAADNKIASVNIVATKAARYLDLSGNLLEDFDLKDFDNLTTLDLSDNLLSEINIAYLGNIENLNISGNHITNIANQIELPNCRVLDVTDNNLTLATLPYFESAPVTYLYAPQQPIVIPNKAPGIDLSKQNRVIDGKGTSYIWKTAGGNLLTAGVDYSITDDGATKFLKTDLGPVYCEMTNPAFPAFSGANALRTTDVTPVGAPTTLVATFTTPEAVNNGMLSIATYGVDALYFDWRGDNIAFSSYDTKGTYTLYTDIETYAGANVKVYTYNSADDVKVFSLSNVPMSKFDGSYMQNCQTLTLDGTGLTADKVIFPKKSAIVELNLENAQFDSFDVSEFPALRSLVLTGNNLTTLDLSPAKDLEATTIACNYLSEITFDNPKLWYLNLDSNDLSEISLEALPSMRQINLSSNKLTTIDISPIVNRLRELKLNYNLFTFATLPVPSEYPGLTVYEYAHQADVDAEIVDMKVDLSSMAEVAGEPTVYRWYLDGFEFDTETGDIIGEELIADDEYFVNNGVTTFDVKFNQPVQALITNATFPNLYLKTGLLYFTSAIEAVEADGGDLNLPVTVYNLQGVAVRTGVLPSEALEGLAPGIYIVAGKKVLVR